MGAGDSAVSCCLLSMLVLLAAEMNSTHGLGPVAAIGVASVGPKVWWPHRLSHEDGGGDATAAAPDPEVRQSGG